MSLSSSLQRPANSPRPRLRIPAFQIIIWIVLLVALAMVLVPILNIVMRAFIIDGRLDLTAAQRAFSDPELMGTVLNTVVLVLTSGTLALIVGSIFAWFTERTDAQSGWIIRLLPIIPLMVPQIAGVSGWVMLLSPAAGLLNAFIRNLLKPFGVELTTGPFDIFSWGGLIFVTTLYLIPYVYLTVAAALRNLGPQLEEASRISGAGPLRTLFQVTLPAVRPGIAAAALIMVILGFGMFSVPIMIGTGAHIEVLSVKIYRMLYSYPPRTDMAVALSMLMMVIIQLTLLLQYWVVSRGHHATIGGKSAGAAVVRLGFWRLPAKGLMFLYLLAASLIPMMGLILVSLQGFWSPIINWSAMTLANYQYVLFGNNLTVNALINSVVLAVIGGVLGMLVTCCLALMSRQKNGRLRAIIGSVTALPAAIPNTVLAVAFIITFAGAPFNLHGTLTILLMAYIVVYLPQAMRYATSAAVQVGSELTEASHVFGAGTMRTFGHVLLPLMLPGLIAGWVILFVSMSSELTASALLAGNSNPVVGQVFLDLWESGSFPRVAALAVTITVIKSVIVISVLTRGKTSLR